MAAPKSWESSTPNAIAPTSTMLRKKPNADRPAGRSLFGGNATRPA